MKFGLPRDIAKRIIARRSALILEASLKGQPVDPEEAQRQAVAEVAHSEKVMRGLVSNPAQESWLAGKQTLEQITKEMEGMPIAIPSPELEAEVEAGFKEHKVDGRLDPVWSKLRHYAVRWAASWRKPSPSAPRATTVEPVAEPQPASKRSVKKTKLPPAPPVDSVAGPLVIVRGGSSTTKWIGGDVPDHSSYGS